MPTETAESKAENQAPASGHLLVVDRQTVAELLANARELPLLLDVHSVARLTALSKATVYRMVSAKQFPRPVEDIGPTRWKRADVEDWVENLR